MGNLTDKQREYLLKPINPRRVLKDRDGMAHLPAYDVEAYLTRFFGVEGWDREIIDLWVIHETSAPDPKRDNRIGWTVTYGCRLRLTVRNPFGEVVKVTDGCATGSANNLPSRGDAHDFAMKNADSYALKRCAKALGDQFGLSLYNKGSLEPVVRESLAYPPPFPGVEPTSTADEPPEPLSLGNDEREHLFDIPEGVPRGVGPIAHTPIADSDRATEAQVKKIRAQFAAMGFLNRQMQIEWVIRTVGEETTSLIELTKSQAHQVIEAQNLELGEK